MVSRSDRRMAMITLLVATLFSAHLAQAQLSQGRFFPHAAYGTPDAPFADEPVNPGPTSFVPEEQFARGPSPSFKQGQDSFNQGQLQDNTFDQGNTQEFSFNQGRFQDQGRLQDTSFNGGNSFPGVVHTVLVPTEGGRGSAVANKATISNNFQSPSAIVTPSFGGQTLRNQDHLLNDRESDVPEFVSVLQVVPPLELLPPKQHVVGRRYPAVDPGPGFVFPPSQINILPAINSNNL